MGSESLPISLSPYLPIFFFHVIVALYTVSPSRTWRAT